jgi:hypothetical protein
MSLPRLSPQMTVRQFLLSKQMSHLLGTYMGSMYLKPTILVNMKSTRMTKRIGDTSFSFMWAGMRLQYGAGLVWHRSAGSIPASACGCEPRNPNTEVSLHQSEIYHSVSRSKTIFDNFASRATATVPCERNSYCRYCIVGGYVLIPLSSEISVTRTSNGTHIQLDIQLYLISWTSHLLDIWGSTDTL